MGMTYFNKEYSEYATCCKCGLKKYCKEDGKLTMCHASIYLNGQDGKRLRLKSVIENIMLPFLDYHKGEALILQIKCDDDDCDQISTSIFNIFWSNIPINSIAATMCRRSARRAASW